MALRMSAQIARLRGELRFEPVAQRVRARYGGQLVLDTTAAMLVWEPRRVVPTYAVPVADLHAETEPSIDPGPVPHPDRLPPVLPPGAFAPHLAPGTVLDLDIDGEVLTAAGFAFDDPDLAGYVLVDWAPFAWSEEDAEMLGHPHDPFSRIKTLPSDRHVLVSLDGTVLADSRRAVLLLETGLPPRWYVPREDLRSELFEDSDTHTTCAYKGVASYLSLKDNPGGRDLAWYYPNPLHDALDVKDLVCLYTEFTDLALDGDPVDRPASPFTRPDAA